MCKFEYHSLGGQGYEYRLLIEINDNSVTFHNSPKEDVSFSFNDFLQMSIEYNQQYGTGKLYYEREIIQKLQKGLSNFIDVYDFVRVFMCSTNLLFRHSIDSNDFEKHVLKEINDYITDDKTDNKRKKEIHFFSDFLFIDWNGRDSVQPQFYFVPHDMDKKALQFFFNLRMLHSVKISVGEVTEDFYYVPFKIPTIRKFAYIKYLNDWHRITREINKHVLKITGGN